ncbi:MAG: metallophosphoesterase, partial [Alphaproteobacteria bacterium]|nr:metallophosphoesterase [Alphaproteobacteria bacterium]
MVLRLAVITDIHYGFDTGVKKGAQAPQLVEDFINQAHQFGADYIVNLGDNVSSQNPIADEQYRKSLRAQFKRAACPVIDIDGNHDVRFQARQSPSASVVTSDHHIIQWNPYLNRYTR